MANISVNITELRALLDVTPSTHNVMLIGNHGIGKSEILTEYYSAKGMPVVALFLGQMSDPGDIIGLPHKDEATGKTTFMPPYWFPTDGKPVCLFLDELNRARPEILQTVMDLCLNRRLAGRALPEGSTLIAAVNYGDQYQLTDLDPALVSRFNVVTFKPTAEEWLLWAKKSGLDYRVVDFINENHIWLDKVPDAKEGADTGMEKTPDRRAWKRVSDVISGRDSLGANDSKVISSIVGAKAASAFLSSVSAHKILSGREILRDFDKHRDTLARYELHELSIVSEGVYRSLEVEKVPEKDKARYAKNVDEYFTFLAKSKKEAAAHFATLYTGETYPNAVGFMARECPYLTMALIQYVRSIR